jgi:hypothetical protein
LHTFEPESMRERSGLLAAFLGIGAFLYHTGGVNEPPKPGTTAHTAPSNATNEEAASDWDLLKNFDEFYEPDRPCRVTTKNTANVQVQKSENFTFHVTLSGAPKRSIACEEHCRKLLRNRFDWIIATVPDPELSELKLDFDREVNSIQNAVESAGYAFDRYWFPWKLADQEPRTADEQSERIESRRRLPGLLLFRRLRDKVESSATNKDLVVFLVGETPTSGIVPGQFKNAIRFGQFSTAGGPIRIAGPGYSGSFASLSQLIDDNRQYSVRTWTGDSASQRDFQRAHPHQEDLLTTNDSSLTTITGLCSYIRKTWQEHGPIVLLVEESTAFGSGLASSLTPELQEKLGRIYILKFPRGISRLRNATETKQQIPGFAQVKGAEALRRALPFTLKEEHIGSSELPHYSTEQTPVLQESVLFSIASLIKKGSLHYAGIVATDPLDLLFLSRFLRSASPNTRLFTIGSDLLFQHGADGADFQGILTITNYPLFAFNQIWTRSGERHNTMQIFSSATSESIYNAVVDLLPQGAPKHFREYTSPFPGTSGESENNKPPLWITVATRNGYAPVAVLDSQKLNAEPGFRSMLINQKYRAPANRKSSQTPEYWESWGYSFLCIWCLCIIYGTAVLFARPTGNRLFAIFSVKPDEPRPLHRAHFLFLLGLCLSILVALWLAVPYIVLRQNERSLNPSGAGEWQFRALLEVLSGIALTVCAGLFARQKGNRPPTPAQWGGLAYVAGVSILLACRVSVLHPPTRHLLAAMPYAGIAFASVILPVSATQFRLFRNRTNASTTFLTWRWVIGLLAVVTLSQIVMLCVVPDFLPRSPSLIRLWTLFYAGAAVMGAAMASTAVPILDAVHGTKRRRGMKSREWVSPLISDVYFWVTIVSAVGAAALLFWTAANINNPTDTADQFLAACRAINITSGVCPLMPLTLLMLSLVIWCFVQLRRVTYHEDRCPRVPDLPDDVFCPNLQRVIKDVKKRIRGDFFHPTYNFVCAVALLVAGCISSIREQQTIESRQMDFVMLSLALLVAVSLLLVCIRFALIWSAFREFLQQLERHPLREIFSFLPRGFLWAPMWQGGNKKRTHVAVTRSLECIRALVDNSRTQPQLAQILKAKLPELTTSVKKLLRFAAQRKRVRAPFYRGLQQQLACIGTAVAAELEQNKWPHGSYEVRSELAGRTSTKDALSVTRDEYKIEEPYTMASELLALRFVPFINYVLLQLQNLAMYLSAGFILLVAAMNSYVFRAQTVIGWFLAALFILLGGAVVTVFSQLDRDAIFSRITRTEEGKLDRNFFLQLISYGGIPTLALLASHVPTVAKFFFSWIKPAMEAIH